jgi:hypothetical protein
MSCGNTHYSIYRYVPVCSIHHVIKLHHNICTYNANAFKRSVTNISTRFIQDANKIINKKLLEFIFRSGHYKLEQLPAVTVVILIRKLLKVKHSYCTLYGDAPLWCEQAHGAIIRGLELHPLLCNLAQLGQGHHLNITRDIYWLPTGICQELRSHKIMLRLRLQINIFNAASALVPNLLQYKKIIFC